jgi:hypothetical protein
VAAGVLPLWDSARSAGVLADIVAPRLASMIRGVNPPLPPFAAAASSSAAGGGGGGSDAVRAPAWHAGASPAEEGLQSALQLFIAAYAHLLSPPSALDDVEFYEREFPLSLERVRAVVSMLNALLRELVCGGTPPAQLKPPRLHLLNSATTLYNCLYQRHCRRPFAPDAAWQWPAGTVKPGDLDPAKLFLGGRGPASTRGSVLLSSVPQVLPFSARAQMFFHLLNEDRARSQSPIGTGVRLKIRRDFLFEDAVSEFARVVHPLQRGPGAGGAAPRRPDGARLKERLQIEFIDETGRAEPGIDGGGLLKEFLDNLTKQSFDPCYGLFREVGAANALCPSPSSGLVAEDHLDRFRFLGRVLGKALYEGVLVEPRFATFFLNKLLGRHNLADELGSLDAELYRSLTAMKSMGADRAQGERREGEGEGEDEDADEDEDDVWEDLALSFDVTVDDFGNRRTLELFPGGSKVAVTRRNRDRYVAFVARFYLEVQTKAQTDGALAPPHSCAPGAASLRSSAPRAHSPFLRRPHHCSIPRGTARPHSRELAWPLLSRGAAALNRRIEQAPRRRRPEAARATRRGVLPGPPSRRVVLGSHRGALATAVLAAADVRDGVQPPPSPRLQAPHPPLHGAARQHPERCGPPPNRGDVHEPHQNPNVLLQSGPSEEDPSHPD